MSLHAQHGRYLNESKNPALRDPKAVAAGGKLWIASCAGCHGPDGSGGARGPNLVRRTLWHPLSDEAVFNAIRNGLPGTVMPETKLSDEDTWNLVAWVKAQTDPAGEHTCQAMLKPEVRSSGAPRPDVQGVTRSRAGEAGWGRI